MTQAKKNSLEQNRVSEVGAGQSANQGESEVASIRAWRILLIYYMKELRTQTRMNRELLRSLFRGTSWLKLSSREMTLVICLNTLGAAVQRLLPWPRQRIVRPNLR